MFLLLFYISKSQYVTFALFILLWRLNGRLMFYKYVYLQYRTTQYSLSFGNNRKISEIVQVIQSWTWLFNWYPANILQIILIRSFIIFMILHLHSKNLIWCEYCNLIGWSVWSNIGYGWYCDVANVLIPKRLIQIVPWNNRNLNWGIIKFCCKY